MMKTKINEKKKTGIVGWLKIALRKAEEARSQEDLTYVESVLKTVLRVIPRPDSRIY